MTLADKKFPSSKAFDLINQALQDNETRTEMMKKANAIFAFDLTAPDGNTQVPSIRLFFFLIFFFFCFFCFKTKLTYPLENLVY